MENRANNQLSQLPLYNLDYTHDQIEALLDKLNQGKMLNEAEFEKLINEIGLENISTFSGSYNDLNDIPNIEEIVQKLIESNTDYLVEIIESWVADQDDAIKESFENKLEEVKIHNDEYATKDYAREYFKTKADIVHRHDDLYATKESEHTHDNQELINKITEEEVKSWNENVKNFNQHKIDAENTYATKVDMAHDLNLKSNVGHNHDNDYGSKLKEHEHANKAVIDVIDIDKLAAWNRVVLDLETFIKRVEEDFATKVNLSDGLSGKSDLTHTHEALYATKESEHTHHNSDVLDLIELDDVTDWENGYLLASAATDNLVELTEIFYELDAAFGDYKEGVAQTFANYTTTEDAIEYLKTILENYYTAAEIQLELEDKVDVADGMGLSTNDFDNDYKELLDEILNKTEEETVKEFILAIINNDANNLEGILGALLNKKADKIEGKDLSTNDYTNEHKQVIEEILTESNANDFVHSVIDEDIANKESGSLGMLFDTKVDKVEGKDLSDNNFTTQHLQIIQEILDFDGNSSKTAREFVADRIADSIIEEATGANSIGEALTKKSNIDHIHDNYVEKIEGKGLSTNDLIDDYATLLEEINEYDNVKSFVDEVIYDSMTNSIDGFLGSEFAKKSDNDHQHDNYVEKEVFAVKATNGQYEIIASGAELGENQIYETDALVAGMIAANILSVGDKVNLQNKVLSEANLTLEEKNYITMMLNQSDLVFSAMIKASILAGDLKVALDKKVDKVTGYSLVKNEEIAKLEAMVGITNSDIDQAILDVFK